MVSGLVVSGHTDTMGDRDYNRSLSKARAGEVSRYLSGKVRSTGLLACGYGEEQLAQWTPDETKSQANRRVQFVILDLDLDPGGQAGDVPLAGQGRPATATRGGRSTTRPDARVWQPR